jgi:hypothetical protein
VLVPRPPPFPRARKYRFQYRANTDAGEIESGESALNWRSGAAASAIKCSGLFFLKRLRAIASYWLEIRFKHWMRQSGEWISFRSFFSETLLGST